MIFNHYSNDKMASKRKPGSADTKFQALDEVNKKVKSKTQIAKEYGVPCSTLSTWLKNKEALRQAHGNFAPARKCIRTAKRSDIQAALLMTIIICHRARNR